MKAGRPSAPKHGNGCMERPSCTSNKTLYDPLFGKNPMIKSCESPITKSQGFNANITSIPFYLCNIHRSDAYTRIIFARILQWKSSYSLGHYEYLQEYEICCQGCPFGNGSDRFTARYKVFTAGMDPLGSKFFKVDHNRNVIAGIRRIVLRRQLTIKGMCCLHMNPCC